MPVIDVVVSCPIIRTPRSAQLEGMFDIQPSDRSEEHWRDELPIDNWDWNIGLIVGPSGSGKSTIARHLFGDAVFSSFDWPDEKSIVDGFPPGMSIKDITALLSNVGFSSPPLWLRPYRVLSTGQKMRVDVARLLAEQPDLVVVDEFTSVVDRTVAQIGCAAIAKTVRKRQQRFVAVSCHYDIVDWLQPDWVYEPHQRRYLQRSPGKRPAIELEICRVHYSAWQLFRQYHYLDHSFNKAARCYVAFYRGEPVAFQAVIATPHAKVKNLYRGHRAVCLPDYQGVGIGSALITYVASAYKGLGNRILSTTASPALNASRSKDNRWILLRKPNLMQPVGATSSIQSWRTAFDRLTATWEYVGPPMDREQAQRMVYG